MLFSFLGFLLCALFHSLAVFGHPTPSDQSLSERYYSDCDVFFEVDLTYEADSSVGYPKQTILVNGTSPGPALHLTVGQTVKFVVHNYLPFSTTIHFHGITQLGTPWSDGVPGVSQNPIPAGATFVYKWTADEYGQYWYHAHYRGQVEDGLYGAIVIAPAADQANPFSSISASQDDVTAMEAAMLAPYPVIVSDWSRMSFEETLALEAASGAPYICPDTMIINGKGSVQCPGVDYINSLVSPGLAQLLNGSQLTAKGCFPLLPVLFGPFPHDISQLPPTVEDECDPTTGLIETITVDPASGWASINFVSAAGINVFEVSIDEHTMYVYAVDGRYIVPQTVTAITIANGMRYSAMIKLDKPVAQYTIRVAVVGINQIASQTAILAYKGSSGPSTSTATINYAGGPAGSGYIPFSDAAIAPFENDPPAATADKTVHMVLSAFKAAWLWTLSGNESYSINYDDTTALLFDPTQPLGQDTNLTFTTNMGDWVDLIMRVPGPVGPPHPIHKHSNKAYVIGSGVGAFNWSTVAEAMEVIPQNFNLVNPPLRDGYSTPPAQGQPTWLAVRYQVVNPGAFLVHCHIQTHLSGGMAMAILDGVDQFPVVPQEYLTADFSGEY